MKGRLFPHARTPLFLLNRQRRLLWVNRAWEELARLPAVDARGLVCQARAAAREPAARAELARVLFPPRDVLEGRMGRVRRSITDSEGRQSWWDIEFFPFSDGAGRLRILGRITCSPNESTLASTVVPEPLLALRERHDRRFTLDALRSVVGVMDRVADQVRLAQQTAVPVLIVGEPGTGKEWLARIIHNGKERARHFACVDCAALPPAALADVLYGDGGLLTNAQIGTIVLRAADLLPRDVQDQLCEWCDEAFEEAPRLIAACTDDPMAAVRAGRLLEALFHRLSTLTIVLPALRERCADLPELVTRMLGESAASDAHAIQGLTDAAWEVVRAYHWPGNLRELSDVLSAAYRRATGDRIDAGDLPITMRLAVNLAERSAVAARPFPLDALLEQVERRLIQLALRQAQGNKSRAAEQLSIWRARLIRRMEALGITDAGL